MCGKHEEFFFVLSSFHKNNYIHTHTPVNCISCSYSTNWDKGWERENFCIKARTIATFKLGPFGMSNRLLVDHMHLSVLELQLYYQKVPMENTPLFPCFGRTTRERESGYEREGTLTVECWDGAASSVALPPSRAPPCSSSYSS